MGDVHQLSDYDPGGSGEKLAALRDGCGRGQAEMAVPLETSETAGGHGIIGILV